VSGPPVVTLYGRPGCHLCEEARAVIRRLAATCPLTLQERNIEESDELLRAYLERIPVICIDGVERFELFVDEQRLLAALAAPAQTGPRDPHPGD
jgi:glutaredoxin